MEADKAVKIAELTKICRDMPLGDIDRTIEFARAMVQSRGAKRQQRRKSNERRQPPLQQFWRLGHE